MAVKRGRVTTLGRIERVRVVERQLARVLLAEAQTEGRRMAELAARSRSLLAGYAGTGDAIDGAGLGTVLAFRGGLAALVQSSASMDAAAAAQSEKMRDSLAAADHRLDLIQRRLRSEAARLAAADAHAPQNGTRIAKRRTSETADGDLV
jgi:hypothetical protein